LQVRRGTAEAFAPQRGQSMPSASRVYRLLDARAQFAAPAHHRIAARRLEIGICTGLSARENVKSCGIPDDVALDSFCDGDPVLLPAVAAHLECYPISPVSFRSFRKSCEYIRIICAICVCYKQIVLISFLRNQINFFKQIL
jgi:hypothetical protein